MVESIRFCSDFVLQILKSLAQPCDEDQFYQASIQLVVWVRENQLVALNTDPGLWLNEISSSPALSKHTRMNSTVR